jgi:hypothetical protein
VSDTNGAPPTTHGPGHGAWSGSNGSDASQFRFFRDNPDGSLAGSKVVTPTTVLAADGSSHTATARSEIRSVTGSALQTTCATDVAMRLP